MGKPTSAFEFFDTHAHLDDDRLHNDVEAVVDRANQSGVKSIVAIGTTAETSERCVVLAERFPKVYAAVGIQPNNCGEVKEGDWERIVALSEAPGVVAIGETGVDGYWDHCSIKLQEEYFRRHIQLARKLNLPFVVHMRESSSEILSVLEDEKDGSLYRGIMHSYTGNARDVKKYLALGLHISFAGMVTFKKSHELREVAKEVPDDRLLIETDAPYLSPEPKRKHRPNEPALVVHTAECLAVARQQTIKHLAAVTTANAKQLFGIA